ncbi:TRAP transporter small permease [Uliginosibacterium sp. sgz301328]|uniref:TRAP transporter small permease n=1 Tax=Uliginosibacterium sp. sgz301328 TaxID=3243764 RepID=UPI00359D62D3
MLKSSKTAIESCLIVATSVMLLCMLGLAIWQVASRYILQSPAIYTEETLRFTMIWAGLMGSAYAFGTDQHLRLVFLLEKLPPAGRRILQTINGLIVIFFSMVILLLGGLRMVASGMDQISPILNIQMGYIYMVLPICAVLISVLQGLNLCLLWQEKNATGKPN